MVGDVTDHFITSHIDPHGAAVIDTFFRGFVAFGCVLHVAPELDGAESSEGVVTYLVCGPPGLSPMYEGGNEQFVGKDRDLSCESRLADVAMRFRAEDDGGLWSALQSGYVFVNYLGDNESGH